jgi:hypothetical protein
VNVSEVLAVGLAVGVALGILIDRVIIAVTDARNRTARRNGR